MKNHLLFALALFIIISIAACKKSNSNPTYFLNFSVNGVTQNADSTLKAQIRIANGNINGEIILTGGIQSMDSTRFIVIDLYNKTSSLKVGTYTDTMSNILLSADYSGYSSGIWEMNTARTLGTPISTHLVVAITSISATVVAGTFSGDFYQSPNYSSPMRITNGRFNVKFN